MQQQILIFCILGVTLFLFIFGRWRYDFIAVLALLSVILTGIIPAKEAFSGFQHPAVITVAAVFAISAALENAGVVDFLYKILSNLGKGFFAQLAILNVFIAAISSFMNNVGALAMLLPVAMNLAKNQKRSPSEVLIPVAFSSILGGMITMIGTPPNIIIALMREQITGSPFGMFDFTPVGLGVAICGILYLSLFGWYLLPKRKGQTLKEDLFAIEDYLTELKVDEDAKCIDQSIYEFENLVEDRSIVIGIIRKKKYIPDPSIHEIIKKGDILVVEADSETLKELITASQTKILGDIKHSKKLVGDQEVAVVEVVVRTDSSILKKPFGKLRLRWRFGINLLAVARSGKRIKGRLSKNRVQPGDVILLRGSEKAINEACLELGLLPLQQRGLKIGQPRQLILSTAIFGTAIAAALLGFLEIQISFVVAVVIMHLFSLLSLKDIYSSIDWSIIVLLGSLIPVGHALEVSGAAASIAKGIVALSGGYHPLIVLTIVLVGTMFLSDLINNASAAILMVPIAATIAKGLNISADPFLMAVAVGASCPFLTPIGHQNNAMILGPGGYQFGDYWKVGLPLECIIVGSAIPLIVYFWPFTGM